MTVSMSISFPLDGGFLRRQCPACDRQFKWHHGPTGDRPTDFVDPAVYFCPYCGETAAHDQWWTDEQVEFIQVNQVRLAQGEIREMLRDLERSTSRGLIQFKVGSSTPDSPAPDALHEPADMVLVEPPCHPWEPIKVLSEWTQPLHCILCGELFAI